MANPVLDVSPVPGAPPVEGADGAGAAVVAPVAADTAPVEPGAEARPAGPDAVRERLLNIALVDNQNAVRHVQSQADFARRGELLLQAVPNKFLEIVDAMRASVRAFNEALVHPENNTIPIVRWHETPNITLRDPFTGDGMMVRISRLHSHCELVLRYVSRNLKPDVPIIEGYGDFGVQGVRRKVLLRIEGWVENGTVVYWYNLDFKRSAVPLHEVPDRLVMAVAKSDYSLLSRNLDSKPLNPDLPPNPTGAPDNLTPEP